MRRRRRTKTVPGVLPRIGRLLQHPQGLIAVVLLITGGAWVWHAAVQSDAFHVTTVLAPPESTLKIPQGVVGQNLWTVNVRGLAQELHQQEPALKQVRVTRLVPNTLKVEVIPRIPMAQLRLARGKSAGEWYAVDREGYLFSEAGSTPWDGLITLRGLESSRDGKAALKPGQLNANPRLLTALRVAERLRNASALGGHRLAAIDVSDPTQVTFVIDDEMEIRCGTEEELDQHLERLRMALQAVTRQQVAVHYIDVRFPDPVIGPRT